MEHLEQLKRIKELEGAIKRMLEYRGEGVVLPEKVFDEASAILYKSEITTEAPKKVVDLTQCQYDKPWQGTCKADAENGYCAKHKEEKCRCGKQATHGCSHAGQFVCGAPLCDECKCKH